MSKKHINKIVKDHEEKMEELLGDQNYYSLTLRTPGANFSEPLRYLPTPDGQILVGSGDGLIYGDFGLNAVLRALKEQLKMNIISENFNEKTNERIITYKIKDNKGRYNHPAELRIKNIGKFVDMNQFNEYINDQGGFA